MRRSLISILLITSIGIVGCGTNPEINTEDIKSSQEVNQKNEDIKSNQEVNKKNKEKGEEKVEEKVEETNNIKRENSIGTSNKKFKDITAAKPMKVRNDVTGNWRVTTITTNENILEYAKDYYENNFVNDNEIHMIVNFTLNTTTSISRVFDMISVTVKERIEKEEHDAKLLGSGKVLSEYFIYLDNGDIEKVE